MIDLAVLPVAGRGTRLLPLTKSQPKEMLPIGRRPVVQCVAEELVCCGVGRMLFITGPGKAAIENHFDYDDELVANLRETGKEELLKELEFERENVEYFYTRQRRQLGLGHAVLCAEPFVKRQDFVVALGDSVIGVQGKSRIVKQMIDIFEEEKAAAVIAFQEIPREEVFRYGVAQPDVATGQEPGDLFRLKDMVEKPSVEEAPSNLAVSARYVFSPAIFDRLHETKPGKGGEIQLTDAVRDLIRDGEKVLGVRLPAGERRYDVGNFESYFEAFLEFAVSDPLYGDAAKEIIERLHQRRNDK